MKWKKVGRLTLKKKGKLVKWAEEKNLELVRIEGEYKFLEENGQQRFYILRRCPCCKSVTTLDRCGWEGALCPECREWGEVT